MCIKKSLFIFSVCFLLIACHKPPFSKNYVDKKGRRQGRWKVFYDAEKHRPLYKGKYRNGKQVGKFQYFLPDGKLYLQEITFQKKGFIETKYFHANGKVELSGKSKVFENKDTSYYQWSGDWMKYDTLGNLLEIQTYREGQKIWTKKITQ